MLKINPPKKTKVMIFQERVNKNVDKTLTLAKKTLILFKIILNLRKMFECVLSELILTH